MNSGLRRNRVLVTECDEDTCQVSRDGQRLTPDASDAHTCNNNREMMRKQGSDWSIRPDRPGQPSDWLTSLYMRGPDKTGSQC